MTKRNDKNTGNLFGGEEPDPSLCGKCRRSLSSPAFGCTGEHRTRPLNREAARAAREAALKQVEENNQRFVEDAYRSIVYLAKTHKDFTTDDVWGYMGDPPEGVEPRAMGAAMRQADKTVITPTLSYRISAMPSCHARPKRVWESLIYREDT